MAQLADALFAYIDELAALALEGYMDARPDGEAEEHRRRLLELLLRRAGARVLAEAAERARWTIPDEVTAVVAPSGARYVRGALDDDVLADLTATQPFLVVPGRPTPSGGRPCSASCPTGSSSRASPCRSAGSPTRCGGRGTRSAWWRRGCSGTRR